MDNLETTKRKCSFCGEEIEPGWRRCAYCGSLLEIKKDGINKIENPEEHNQLYTGDIDSSSIDNVHEETEDAEKNDSINDSQLENDNTGFTRQVEAGPGYYDNEYKGLEKIKPLSNGMKVFLTAISTVVPGIGQLIGLIASIMFMNSEEDPDRRSFGVALLVASLITFVVSCLYFSVLIMAFVESTTK